MQALRHIGSNRVFYLLAALYIAIGTWMSFREFYLWAAFPLVLLALYVAFTRLDLFLLTTVALVPLSTPLSEIVKVKSIDLYLPTEPMLALILLLVIFKAIRGQELDRKLLRHPVSVAIYINLAWMIITTITSTMPWVSVKFLVARLWFLAAFYFLAAQLFRKFSNIERYTWLYIGGFAIVIIFATIHLNHYGLLNKDAAHWVVRPFYKDHTSYGAIVAMLLPFLAGAAHDAKRSPQTRFLVWMLLLVFMAALVFSYSRAAWVSVLGAIGLWAIIRLRIHYLWLLGALAALALLLFAYRVQIMLELEQNKQDSSDYLTEHVRSISNVATDASNLERINRWKSALRMFAEKPLFGWGPGTYMFQYAPFQMSYDKTIISTNAGTMGNAHSEYLGPLSETGLPGALSFLCILGLVVYTAVRRYYKLEDKHERTLLLSALLGLSTYYVHGVLNNFLDTDKASALFWGFTAIIVAIDLRHRDSDSAN